MDHDKTNRKGNRLIGESSPYLVQHATNPVNWYPWGQEAFEKAKARDLPIFLSIGYSTCHWCHVMAKESFQDQDVADILNRNFISIKVDREANPDVDAIYMEAVVLMTGSGGWPLSVFLTPEGKPFFGGTYFPKESRFGLPGFKQILVSVSRAWRQERQKLIESAEDLLGIIRNEQQKQPGKLDAGVLEKCYSQVSYIFDRNHAGFGAAPKFPSTGYLRYLNLYYFRTGQEKAVEMVTRTLDAMARGGICDQLGGGFHRYSTDAQWRIPHFEKMLYDQAQLVDAYLDGFQLTGKQSYQDTITQTLDFVIRELGNGRGGFYSALDADSDGKEGTFYVWTHDQVQEIVGEENLQVACACFGITPEGNFEDGANVLYQAMDVESVAEKLKLDSEKVSRSIALFRLRLLDARAKRNRPGRDEKIIAGWNGMFLAALARAAAVLGRDDYLDHAKQCGEFLVKQLCRGSKVFRYYVDWKTYGKGVLEDYAFLAAGLIELYQATGQGHWITSAIKITDEMLRRFEDKNDGFFYSDQDADLVVRTRSSYDGAMASGYSTACLMLWRLGLLTGNEAYLHAAQRAISVMAEELSKSPLNHSVLMQSVDFEVHGGNQVVIARGKGETKDSSFLKFQAEYYQRFIPAGVLACADLQMQERWQKILQDKVSTGEATGYVCREFTCQQPVTDVKAFADQLDKLGHTKWKGGS